MSLALTFFSLKPLIIFESTGSSTPKGHTTATLCRPDVIARRTSEQLHWADFEATIEIESKGK